MYYTSLMLYFCYRLERESSPLVSADTSSTVPVVFSVPDQRASPYLSIMKEIDGNWIHKQKSHKSMFAQEPGNQVGCK